MSPDRLDLSRLGLATIVAAGLSLSLAVAFLRHAESTPAVGPTAASLDEAFSEFFGAGLGLALGAAVASFVVRRGPRVLSGLIAGLLAYVLVIAPVFVATGPDDVSIGEIIGIAAYLTIPLVVFVLLGASIGSFIAPLLRRRHQRQPVR
jgi:hypothetical protein